VIEKYGGEEGRPICGEGKRSPAVKKGEGRARGWERGKQVRGPHGGERGGGDVNRSRDDHCSMTVKYERREKALKRHRAIPKTTEVKNRKKKGEKNDLGETGGGNYLQNRGEELLGY